MKHLTSLRKLHDVLVVTTIAALPITVPWFHFGSAGLRDNMGKIIGYLALVGAAFLLHSVIKRARPKGNTAPNAPFEPSEGDFAKQPARRKSLAWTMQFATTILREFVALVLLWFPAIGLLGDEHIGVREINFGHAVFLTYLLGLSGVDLFFSLGDFFRSIRSNS